MSRLHVNQSGYSLTEIIIATALTGLLLVMIIGFMTNALVQNSITIARGDVLREAQIALDTATRDIRLSSNADDDNRWQDQHAPDAPSDLFSWRSDADTLVLATSAEDANNNILFEDALHYISYKNNNIYFVTNGTLYKRSLAAPVTGSNAVTTCPEASATNICPSDRRLAQNVTTFSIRYLDGDDVEVPPDHARSIEMTLGLSTTKYGRELSAEYKTRSVFRNE